MPAIFFCCLHSWTNEAEENGWTQMALVHTNVGYSEDNYCITLPLLRLSFSHRRSPFFPLHLSPILSKQSLSEHNDCSDIKYKGFINFTYCLELYYPETIPIIKKIIILFCSSKTALQFVPECALMQSWYLSGVLRLPCSFISNIISEESSGELALASRRSCSCWARYWAGVCLANRAQWSSSLCSRGRFAFSGKKKWDRHLCIRKEINHRRKDIDFSCWCKCREEC